MPSGPSDLAAPPFVDHLTSESARFRAVLAEAPPGLRVPTCPDWDADDLLWHLAEVQWFWGEIAAGRLTTQAEVDDARRATGGAAGRPGRPARALRPLQQQAPDGTRVARPRDRAVDVGRRAHGRLHREAPGPRGARPPPRRRADRRVTHAARLSAGSRRGRRGPAHHARLRARAGSETRGRRSVRDDRHRRRDACLDRDSRAGHRPLRGQGARPAALPRRRRSRRSSAAEICGSAADLDCWLWNRPPADEITREGDAGALAAVDRVLGGSID